MSNFVKSSRIKSSLPFMLVSVAACVHLSASPQMSEKPTASGEGTLLDQMFLGQPVLQAGSPVRVSGRTTPGAVVNVRLGDVETTARASGDGRWSAELAPQMAGSTPILAVKSSASDEIESVPLTFGQVWLCTGQSNIDLSVGKAANSARIIQEAGARDIHIMKVRRSSATAPASDIRTDIPWVRASRDNIADFSSVCWHMGLKLSKELDVPIGLVQSSWGGTTIEDWSSRDALAALGGYEDAQRFLDTYATDPEGAMQAARDRTMVWAAEEDPGSRPGSEWWGADFDASDWPRTMLPGTWERSGIDGLASYDGVMWYRRTLTLTDRQAADGGTLKLGRIDERDTVWINGVLQGSTIGTQVSRAYAVRPGSLRAGTNVIAVRVIDEKGSGGISAEPADLMLETASGDRLDLSGEWQYQTGVSRREWSPPPFVPWFAPRGMTTLFNAMIAPLTQMPVAGVVWYQGESNTSEAELYARLLPIWIADWRRAFGDPELPFVIVQLPGFGALSEAPSNASWAQLREVQRDAANADARTGLAVTIDLGTVDDIHPTHKLEVGRRVALEALRVAYGRSVPVSPQPVGATYRDGEVIVTFAQSGAGLRVYGARSPSGFEVCDGKGVCAFADARLEGDRVIIAAGDDAPARVRYAWQAFPIVNLYGADRLPVIPFEIAVRAEKD